MKLYTDPGNFQTLKILIASKLTENSVETVKVKQAVEVAPFLLRWRLPVLEVEEGKSLFSPNTAAKYLFLKGNKVSDEDAENEILDWESSEILPRVATFLVSTVGYGKKDNELIDQLLKVLQQIDSKLAKTTYILGDQLGISDVCVFSTLYPLSELNNLDMFNTLPNVQRWCNEIKVLPVVQAALTEVTEGKGLEAFKQSLLTQNFLVSTLSDTVPTTTTNSPASEALIPAETVTQEELDNALSAWRRDPQDFPKPKHREHPILPEENSRNILITSALPYVNNVPHLGNIIGCVLSADVFSRFARLRNYNVLYICGTDEYGTATETKAMEEGVTPKQICDKYNKLHTQIYKWFNIDFDHFGRTTTEQQTEIAQDIFWKLYNRGYVLKDSVDQLHCQKCDKFLADRFVEGTCPQCKFDDARGDQCDGCGKLINAVELKDPKCKICKSSPSIRTSEHLFLDLPELEPVLKTHLDRVFESGTWTNNARVITSSWIRDGLKPRCISRDLKWGTPIPLEGYTDKVFYVWFDAPIGYISITANYTCEWKQWWKNPRKVELYNFLGKDNVPFHSVIFPACLLGTSDDYTVVNHMAATEYLNYEDTKFSKSRNSGIFGDQAETTGISADVYRFYLLYVRPESQDTAFSWDDFLLKNNSELLNNLGNFINRALMFLSNTFEGVLQEMSVTEEDIQLLALITRELKSYISNLEACRLRDGIRNILTISRFGNQYMQACKPWVLAKGSAEDKKRAGSVVSLCANIACLLSVLLQPYMPTTSTVIQQQLLVPSSVSVIFGEFVVFLQPGHRIGKPSPLFQKIETATAEELKSRFAGATVEKSPSKKPASNQSKPQGNESNGPLASSEEVEHLTKAVCDQGNKVRDLKASKAEASVINAEVTVLLQLKKELSLAQGQDPAATGKGGKKGGKSFAPNNVPMAGTVEVNAPNTVEVERLTQAISEQGNKVRELKSSKAEKSVIDSAVASLLQLKQDLALLQVQDANVAVSANKKGKKKK